MMTDQVARAIRTNSTALISHQRHVRISYTWPSLSSLAREGTFRHQHQSHRTRLHDLRLVVHVCTILALYPFALRPPRLGHKHRLVTDFPRQCLSSSKHAGSRSPQPVFTFTSTQANLGEFRSLPALVHHSLSHHSLILFFFSWMVPNQAHDKSTRQQCQERCDHACNSLAIQVAGSLSSHSRCCLHVKSGLCFADLDRTANRSSTRVPSTLIRHALGDGSSCSRSCVFSLSLPSIT